MAGHSKKSQLLRSYSPFASAANAAMVVVAIDSARAVQPAPVYGGQLNYVWFHIGFLEMPIPFQILVVRCPVLLGYGGCAEDSPSQRHQVGCASEPALY